MNQQTSDKLPPNDNQGNLIQKLRHRQIFWVQKNPSTGRESSWILDRSIHHTSNSFMLLRILKSRLFSTMLTSVLEQLEQIKLIEKGEKIMWEVKNEKEQKI